MQELTFKTERSWVFYFIIQKIENTSKMIPVLTLPLPSLLVPTHFTKGEGGSARPRPSHLKNRCPHEREIL